MTRKHTRNGVEVGSTVHLCFARVYDKSVSSHVEDLPFSNYSGIITRFGKDNNRSSKTTYIKCFFTSQMAHAARNKPCVIPEEIEDPETMATNCLYLLAL